MTGEETFARASFGKWNKYLAGMAAGIPTGRRTGWKAGAIDSEFLNFACIMLIWLWNKL